MSKYTRELRYIIQDGYDLGLDTYPIFEEQYRVILNQKILDHFAFREIGFETVPLFKFMLNRKMNEIMELYNQKYLSDYRRLDVNPFDSVDLTDTTTRTTTIENTNDSEGTTSSNSTATDNADNISITSDSPQGSMTDADIRGNKFASGTEHNLIDADSSNNTTSNMNTTTTANGTETETVEHRTYGNSAGYTNAQTLKFFRDIFMNVDMEICEELEDLFIQLW